MRQITYREALKEAMREEMTRDSDVFLLGEDIGKYGGVYAVTKGLFEEFGPHRVMDTPLAEAVIVGAATGAAAVGARPVAEIMYVNFMTFCMDQIVNQAAKMRYMFGGKIKVPMVIRTQGGAGTYCAAQHSESLESWFIHIPNHRTNSIYKFKTYFCWVSTSFCSLVPCFFIQWVNSHFSISFREVVFGACT